MNGILIEGTKISPDNPSLNDNFHEDDLASIHFIFTYSDDNKKVFDKMGIMKGPHDIKDIIVYDDQSDTQISRCSIYDFNDNPELSASVYKLTVLNKFSEDFFSMIDDIEDNQGFINSKGKSFVFDMDLDYSGGIAYKSPKFFSWLFSTLDYELFDKNFKDTNIYDFVKFDNLKYVMNKKIKNF